jgi:hypothetical protein
MEDKATLIESLIEKTEAYANISFDLLKLNAIDKSANMLSSLASTLILALTVLCITMMVNIGAALWIGQLMGNSFYGFFIVAGFYLLVWIVLSIFNKQLLKEPLHNTIVLLIRKGKNT